jgi:spoIIIJ-associated protein
VHVSEGVPPINETTDATDATDAVDAVEEPQAEEGTQAEEGAQKISDDDGGQSALEREGDIAADYLEELLDIADLDGDLDLDVEGDRAAVSIIGDGLGHLVGRDGDVLEALQELTRLAVLRATGERSRLMLDIAGHRAGKRSALEEQAREVVAQVRDNGEAQKLAPMTPFERKVVHDAVAAAGLKSESEGEEPHRCVVVLPT